MTSENREELISAYVDDELTSDERGRAEAYLAESPELRAFRDELLAMRGQLQSLPRHSLDRDLAGAVVRKAERSVLDPQSSDREPGAISIRDASQEPRSRRSGWRRIAWPAIAVAAALLVYVFGDRQPVAERQVAQHAPREQGSIGAAKPTTEQAASAAAEPSNRADSAVDKPADELKFGARAGAPAQGKVAGEGLPMREEKKSLADSAPLAPAAPAAMKAKTDTQPLAQNANEQLPIVEFDVTPEFVQTNQFEAVLKARKIGWQRVGQNALNDRQVKEPGSRDAKDAEPVEQFLVNVTPDQLTLITSDLERDEKRVVNMRAVNLNAQALEYRNKQQQSEGLKSGNKEQQLMKRQAFNDEVESVKKQAFADQNLGNAATQAITIRLRSLPYDKNQRKAEP